MKGDDTLISPRPLHVSVARQFSRGKFIAVPKLPPVLAVLCLTLTATCHGQLGAPADRGSQLGGETTVAYRAGAIITADAGPCRGIVAIAPVPFEWREQEVRVVEEDVTANVHQLEYVMVGDTVKQMAIHIPFLPAGEEARAVITFEVTRRRLLPPEDTSHLSIPARVDRDVRQYLGASPGIESRSPTIRSLAREIVGPHADTDAWTQVEAIYDWVRGHVKYIEGPFKGALSALKEKSGDCEELSSLFIALCRAHGVPARTVWVPGHCYAEFYLVDGEGQGHWFPCQPAGDRDFGGIPETRPILQKGDNFRPPYDPRQRQRYMAEFLKGDGGTPRVKFVRDLVDAAQISP